VRSTDRYRRFAPWPGKLICRSERGLAGDTARVEPGPVSQPPSGPAARLARIAGHLRLEDWLLVAWLVVAAPLLGRVEDTAGPFDAGRPIQGALELIAVLGAMICLVTGRSDAPAGADPGILGRGAIGPLVGGLLLVTFSGWDGLGLAGTPAAVVAVVIAGIVVVVRLRWAALTTSVRRALVTPFILVTGGIFWTIVDSITGGQGVIGSPTAGLSLRDVGLVVGLLAVFSAVYYAMLVYAPRQVAESEGGTITWLVRYGVFLASVVVGISWLRPLGM